MANGLELTMTKRRNLIILGLVLLACPVAMALAHPMGNFSISHYTALRVAGDGLHVRYRLDLAEIPTFREMAALDKNGDREISVAEREAYLSAKVPELTAGQRLTVNGESVKLAAISSDLQVRPGAGNLPTLLITIDYRAALGPLQERNLVEYSDNNFSERAGWREIIAAATDTYPILDSTVPLNDQSGELTSYPSEATIAPPQVSRARFTFGLRGSESSIGDFGLQIADLKTTSSNPKSAIRNPQSAGRLAELITAETLSPNVILLSLVVAFVLGSFHALTPGHGKTVVAAYLVGSRGTARHAFFLGAVVTLTHTIGVFALGLVALFASEYMLPEQLYPWLGFASGLTIVGIGGSLFVKRLRAARRSGAGHLHHDHGDGHHHHPSSREIRNPKHEIRNVSDLGFGISDFHPHGHSHHIEKITWGNLLALGVSGGIVPCPSALVVLLSAITLHRIGFGLILIVAFSFGLASVLIGIGLLMLYARRFMDRFSFEGGLVKRLPILSAAIISVLGLVIAVKSLVDGGVLRISFDLSQAQLMPALGAALGLGFVLGLKHALDADHVAAVSTIVSEHQSVAKSSLVGAFWGLGHTGSLLIVGLLVIVFRLTIPETVALSLEFVVAMMLVVLGANALRKAFGFQLHQHEHRHEREVGHEHLHLHLAGTHHHEETPVMKIARRPLVVGMVHGLAGSAALVLLVLTTIPSVVGGLLYILAFGIGSMAGMLVMSALISAPFVFSARRFFRLNHGIRVAAGLFSVAFGLFLAWRIGVVERLLF
jgi:ABC-type nickel/cobalt efflux system permease component RcnA